MTAKVTMPSCTIEGCLRPMDRNQLCSIHYIRMWKFGDPLAFRKNQRGGDAATVTPTIRNLEWAAGLYEGEGSCSCGNRPGDGFQVTMTQNNIEPLDRMHRLFGGRKPYLSRPATGNRSDQHRWYASGCRARGIVMTLYPLLSTKRQAQIRKALKL